MANKYKSRVDNIEEVEVTEIPRSETREDKRDWSTIWIILGIIYILSPLDFLPEAILGPLGFADDGAMLIFLIKKLYDKLKK